MDAMMTNTMENPLEFDDNIDLEVAGPRNIVSDVVEFIKLSFKTFGEGEGD